MELTIYHTNDIHSRLENFAKIATILKKEKTNHDLLLDAGDFHDLMRLEITGTKGKAGKYLLESLDYDAITIGNNEFFGGIDYLTSLTTTGNVPLLSCNLYYQDMSHIEGIKRSILISKDQYRFLVIGASPMYNEFLSLMGICATNPIEEIKKEIELNKGNYDFCVLLSHLGYQEDIEIAREKLGIDIIIGGHSHTNMPEAIKVEDTIIHQSGNYGELLGKLAIDIEDDKIVNFNGVNIITESFEEDEKTISLLLNQKEIAINNLSVPLYSIDQTLWHDVVMENPITNFICDALYKNYRCDFALMNSGIVNCGIEGTVNELKLLQMSPSPLNPTSALIKGKNIVQALSETLASDHCLNDGRGAGFRGKYLGRLHVSNNVMINVINQKVNVLIDHQPIDENKEYLVMTSDYLQRGTGYPSLASENNVTYKKEYIRDVLKDTLKNRDLVNHCLKKRWHE